jgi:hypothetical protein
MEGEQVQSLRADVCERRSGSGHHSFKVFWRKEGDEKGKRIAWMEEGRKPSEALAIFYCKVACAIEDGLEKYHYHDKALTPPRKDFKPRLRSLTTIELKRENE